MAAVQLTAFMAVEGTHDTASLGVLHGGRAAAAESVKNQLVVHRVRDQQRPVLVHPMFLRGVHL